MKLTELIFVTATNDMTPPTTTTTAPLDVTGVPLSASTTGVRAVSGSEGDIGAITAGANLCKK